MADEGEVGTEEAEVTPPPQSPEDDSKSAPKPAPKPKRAPRNLPRMPAQAASTMDSGAGFVLGLLAWGWIVLPFLQNGPTGVKNTLRAKFFNRAPDGSWLP